MLQITSKKNSMKQLIILLAFLTLYNSYQGQNESPAFFGFALYTGSSLHGELDRPTFIPSPLISINSRVVLNYGLDIRTYPIRLSKVKIYSTTKFGMYRLKMKIQNFYVADHTYMHYIFYTDLGVGIEYQLSPKSNIYLNPTYQVSKLINSQNKFATNYGLSIGYERKIKKLKFGIEYYQRLYFTGFNREIARVMLRVGF